MARERQKLKTDLAELGLAFVYQQIAPLLEERERLAYMRGRYDAKKAAKSDPTARIQALIAEYKRKPTDDMLEFLLLGLLSEERGSI